MAKSTTAYVCQSCGAAHGKWSGRCEACGAWNSLIEEAVGTPGGLEAPKTGTKTRAGTVDFSPLDSAEPPPPRLSTGIDELDRVFGGGIARSSAVLVGGDPGIGKSTLLLQAAASMAKTGVKCVYISGEEAVSQIQGRARRLGVTNAPVQLAAETDLRSILKALKASSPELIVIDSVQTLWSDSLEAAPGSVAQVRACAQELTRFAKKTGAAVILVGHVTKDGQIAGPRVLEHMVDAVFYFEGERGHQFRILRSVKNRFGPTDEIGVFEMGELGRQRSGSLRPRGIRRDGRITARARRSAGAGGAGSGGQPAALDRRMGQRATIDAVGGVRCTLRAAVRHAGCVSQCYRRLSHRRAGR